MLGNLDIKFTKEAEHLLKNIVFVTRIIIKF